MVSNDFVLGKCNFKLDKSKFKKDVSIETIKEAVKKTF